MSRFSIKEIEVKYAEGRFEWLNERLAKIVMEIVARFSESKYAEAWQDAGQDFLEECVKRPEAMWRSIMAKSRTMAGFKGFVESCVKAKMVNSLRSPEVVSLHRNLREALKASDEFVTEPARRGSLVYGLASWGETAGQRGVFNGTWDTGRLSDYPPFEIAHKGTDLPNYTREDLQEAGARLLEICGCYCTGARLVKGVLESDWFLIVHVPCSPDDALGTKAAAPSGRRMSLLEHLDEERLCRLIKDSLSEREIVAVREYGLPKIKKLKVTLHQVAKIIGCSHTQVKNLSERGMAKLGEIAASQGVEEHHRAHYVTMIMNLFEKGRL